MYQILVCTCSQRCYNPNLTQAWPSQILMFSICTSLFHSQLLKVFTLQHHDLCQYLFDKRLEAKGSMAVFLQPWLRFFMQTWYLCKNIVNLIYMSYGQARYFNNFGFKFIHLLADEKNYFCFTFLKLFDDFSSAQSCLRTFINMMNIPILKCLLFSTLFIYLFFCSVNLTCIWQSIPIDEQ